MRKTGFLAALGLIAAAALTACGGGGDNAFQGAGTAGSGGSGSGSGTGTGTTGQTVQLGNGTGSGFTSGAIALSSSSLSAGGSTSLTVSLVQADGSLYTTATSITFNSPCVAAGQASITPSAQAATSTGTATVTYVAKGCSGSDVITATASVGTATLTATGTVTVAQAAIGSIAFVSATPNNIALKGTGDANRPESSTVIFKVLDAAGGPRSAANVSFALNTSVGGITLQPSTATATSDAQGNVQIVVNAGTVATSVKVTATVTGTTPISTQSSQLTITTGIPTANSFSLALGCFNVEGLGYDGTITPVTARLADRFGNPVPDGTAVTFTAEGGAVQAQCTTTTTPQEGGVCSVNWRSSNPRPSNGRITVLAKAIGEESFVDSNGNGAFDNGETFADTSEPFRDDNEDGAYTAGTDADFFDFNSNSTRDGPDTLFNGVLCNDTTGRCGGAATRSAGIGASAVIIMSGSNANITDTSGAAIGPITLATSSSRVVTIWVRDVNGNVMPGGTAVSASFSGSGVTVGTPNSFDVPCTNIAANSKVNSATVFSFGISSSTTIGSGTLTIGVKTPGAGTNGSTTTILQIPVTVQ